MSTKRKRGPQKPAREMTDREAAERLFGKRVIRKVDRELEEAQATENAEESEEEPDIEGEDT